MSEMAFHYQTQNLHRGKSNSPLTWKSFFVTHQAEPYSVLWPALPNKRFKKAFEVSVVLYTVGIQYENLIFVDPKNFGSFFGD